MFCYIRGPIGANLSQLFSLLNTGPGSLVKPFPLGLLISPKADFQELQQYAALLALRGPVKVLDGGNHFNVFDVAYTIRRMTADLYRAAENIHIVRAFTCFEVLRGLEEMPSGSPVLLIDLLATFYDDAVSDKRAAILFEQCLTHINRLKQLAPIIASATLPGSEVKDRKQFLLALISAADLVEDGSQTSLEESPRLF